MRSFLFYTSEIFLSKRHFPYLKVSQHLTHMSRENPSAKVIVHTRLQSVDLLRGAVMVLMAIDHVRVYSGLPAGGPAPGIFFTRWVTHFCAPAFVFLAGTSAFLYGIKMGNKSKLARYLLTRGILLVVLELTLIRLFWTSNLNFPAFMLAGVIWMIGWCMVLLSAFIWLRPALVGIIGLVIIFGQTAFQYVPRVFPVGTRETFGRYWEFIYTSGVEGPSWISILYVIVPWIGVMAAGYGFGTILLKDDNKQRKICLAIGISAIVLFITLGSIIAFQRPEENEQPFIFRLLNQRKYPASELYLLMTLGPVIALVPFAEKVKGWLARLLVIIGSVPFFYYLLHILIIHISAVIVNFIRMGTAGHEWYANAPFTWMPPEYHWPLWLLYVIFVIDVAVLYLLCRWYAKYKFAHPGNKWLRYL